MKFLDAFKKVLSADKRFLGENQQIIKTKVSEAARSNDKKLLKALLKNDLLKESFFTKVDDIYVFDKNKFVWVLESKEFLPDSYTVYRNKVGLVGADYNPISQKRDVSLVWPYKDCVLEGGQTKDDQKRNEIFYNEILAPDQVNRLLAPKVLSNAKRYTKDDVEENIEFKDDDNLIIKGNNLLALSSLLKRKKYEDKVQLIYIDPPYNTGSDSFGYNDNYNHATWLTFMKNRLKLAHRLLSKTGCIWINIDDDEAHYLKVLCDEIFGRENFVANIIWKKKYSPQNDARYFSDMHDHIILFAKDKKQLKVNGLPRTEKMDSRYQNIDNDPRGPWKSGDFSVRTYNESTDYPITTPSGRVVNPPTGRCWRASKEKFEEMVKDNRIWFGEDGSNVPSVKRFLADVKQSVTPQTIWDYSEVGHNQEAIQNLNKIFGEKVFDTPKPEALLRRILHIGSKADDYILDFFMGSGTTAAVAHKMGRRYIGVEQMDYIEDVTVERLKKVIDGEQGGISKAVDWKGGGSFVYCELLEDSESLVTELEAATTSAAVKMVLNKAIDGGKLIPSVLPGALQDSMDDFDSLSMDEQKKLVMELLNKNKLYVNLSDIDDEDYGVSEADKKFTRSFYGEE
ncbi:MAG: site-specific DNA-methyltransferase [Negativicoccus massiliensis]|nr:site-specific DNA-methyltransferase [Negativicoccus massiliensis]